MHKRLFYSHAHTHTHTHTRARAQLVLTGDLYFSQCNRRRTLTGHNSVTERPIAMSKYSLESTDIVELISGIRFQI